MSICSANSKSI